MQKPKKSRARPKNVECGIKRKLDQFGILQVGIITEIYERRGS